MYLIDQHAAHERVLFETIKDAARTGSPSIQGLMEPATVDLTPEQVEIVEAHRPSVNGLGFEFEEFGGTTFMLRGVPALLVSEDPPGALRDVLDLMAEGGGYESWEERAAYSLACHSAIRAGKVLTSRETEELVRQLEQCSQPHTCPHGRPTMIHLSAAQAGRGVRAAGVGRDCVGGGSAAWARRARRVFWIPAPYRGTT